MNYFRKYTVPSVVNQERRPAGWIIYCDPESPSWLKEEMSSLRRDGIATPIYREAVSRLELISDIDSVLGCEASRVITSNLDNDDGLAADFVSRLASTALTTERSALYITEGLIRSGDRVFLVRDRHNAFCSVIEGRVEMTTCWADWHNRLHLQMPTTELPGEPGWLQVVHGRNVSNRVRGKLVDPRKYRSLFPAGLDDCPSPTRALLLRDHYVLAPLRELRDWLRSRGAQLVIGVFGKSGLDDLLERLALLRERVRARLIRPGSSATATPPPSVSDR